MAISRQCDISATTKLVVDTLFRRRTHARQHRNDLRSSRVVSNFSSARSTSPVSRRSPGIGRCAITQSYFLQRWRHCSCCLRSFWRIRHTCVPRLVLREKARRWSPSLVNCADLGADDAPTRKLARAPLQPANPGRPLVSRHYCRWFRLARFAASLRVPTPKTLLRACQRTRLQSNAQRQGSAARHISNALTQHPICAPDLPAIGQGKV